MSRHERDAVSLMGGLLLVLVALAVLVEDLTGLQVDAGLVAPLVLVAVGAAGLLATMRGSRTTERTLDSDRTDADRT